MPMHHSRAQLAARPSCAASSNARIEHELGHAVAVAQVDEHAPAVIAVGLHPAGQDDLLADVAGAQLRRSYGFVYAWRGTRSWERTIRTASQLVRSRPTSGFPSSCDQIRSLGLWII